jgi:GTP-binding protein Era
MGIANGPDHQLVLADLPGFQRPRDALTERMQRTVDQSLEEIDACCSSSRPRADRRGDRYIAERVFALGVPVVIALNKVDRLKPGHIAEQMQNARGSATSSRSTRQRDHGRRRRRASRRAGRPAARGPGVLPGRPAQRRHAELHVAELIREKALHLTREEVPHAISVEVDELGDKAYGRRSSSRPSRRSRS